MKRRIKSIALTGTLIAGLSFGIPAPGKNVSLAELKNSQFQKLVYAEKQNLINSNHWAYKTLQDIRRKYNLTAGNTGIKLDEKEPITRDEAAIIFVNLVGKIEEKNLQLQEAEKVRVEIIEQELNSEITKLVGRVEELESGISILKGRISNLENQNKKLWGHAYGEDFKITGGVRAQYYGNFSGGNPSRASNFSLPYSELRLTGKISEHVSYRALAVPGRNFNSSANGILDDLYISADIIPKHEVQLGQIWLPFGMEAPMYNMDIDFIEYSQISRNLGMGLDTGTQIIGDLGFVNYTAGVYNGVGQNVIDNNHGLGYASQLNILPFYKHPGLGELVIGGSHLASKNATNNLDGIGGHVSYDIGKFGVNFEYLNVDGIRGLSTNKGEGFYADFMYRYNNKLTLLTRFDQFNPSEAIGKDERYEYIFGASYMLTKNLKLMVNYTYADRLLSGERDSNRLGLMTQVMF